MLSAKIPRLATPLIVLLFKVRTSLVEPAEITALFVTPVFIQSPPTVVEAVKAGWLAKEALKSALSVKTGTPLGFQLPLVAQTVLLAPVHALSVANADWPASIQMSAMIWMPPGKRPANRFDGKCDSIVEQNFMGREGYGAALPQPVGRRLLRAKLLDCAQD